jgi:hypothetical protein
MIARKPLLRSCLAVAAGLLAARAALAHTPPPVYLTSELNSEELVLTCVVGEDLFKDWLSFDPGGFAELPKEDAAARQAEIEAFFAQWNRVVADGIPVKGVFRGLEKVAYEDHEIAWKFVHVKIAYGMKAMPNQLSLTWTLFDNHIGWWLDYIQGEIIAEGYGGRYFDFTRKEPEYIWHRPATPRVAGSITDPVYTPPPPLVIPLVSAGIILVLAAAVPVFRIRRVRRRNAWGFVGLCAVLARLSTGWAQVEVEAPWRSAYQPPSRAEAAEIFATLHRNIYRAFDYTSEDDIYNTLARSVTGQLLDRLYIEVYESLIMQDQGGAMSRIQGVRILDTKIEFPQSEDLAEFTVVCTWQVKGRVSHWGHTHERVNEYRARYGLGSDGRKWRIAEVETLDERRLEDEEAARTWDEK